MLHFANIELPFSFFLKGMTSVIIISSFTLYIKMKMLKDLTLETKKIPNSFYSTVFLWPKKPCERSSALFMCPLEGASREVWDFEATLFVDNV